MKNLKLFSIFLVLVFVVSFWTPAMVTPGQATGLPSGAVRAQGEGHLSGLNYPALKQVESNKAKQTSDPEYPADSLNIVFVGQSGGIINRVTLQGNYAYVNEGQSLTILDISVPGSVAAVGRSSLFSSWVGGIAVTGSYAYIANSDAGLRLLDISNPADPVEVSVFDTPGSVYDVSVAENYAYLADFVGGAGGGLRVLDVSDPGNPVEVGFLEMEMAARVVLSGSYAYVVRGMYRSMLVVDISDPTNPVEVGSYNSTDNNTGVAILGNYAYVSTFQIGLRIVDISDPTNPMEVGFYDSPGNAFDVAVDGSYAYLSEANTPYGLRIIDISDPTDPTEAGFFTLPGAAYGVAVAEKFAYVADSNSGLRVVDVSDPDNLIETDHYSTPSYAQSVKVAGNYAYLADGETGLKVVDVSVPACPLVASEENAMGFARNIAIEGAYAYVADSGNYPDDGLRIIDISDPANPIEVGFYDTLGQTVGVAVAGDVAYIVSDGLRVVDVSDPTNPLEIGMLSLGATDVAVAGNYAYLAMGALGSIRVVDITDPTKPVEVSNLGAGYFDAPTVVEDYAYVPNGEAGLAIVDVSNPISSTITGVYDTPGSAADVAVDGNYVYVADGYGSGVRMIDISDPTNPVEVGYYDTPDYALGVSVDSGLIYVADSQSGLIILRYTGSAITTTTSIQSDEPDPSMVGQPFTVTFGVTSTLGTPTGVVTVTVSDSAESCSGVLVDGLGACQMALSTPGTYTLTATYAGDGEFQPSSDTEQHTASLRRVYLPLLLNSQSFCSDFFDDFSDPDSGWFVGEDNEVRAEYLNGEYSVLVKPADFYWILGSPACDQDNYTVEVDARWAGETGASYGLIFGLQGDFEQLYSFEVNTNFQDFTLSRFGGGSWVTIVPITSSPAIHAGAETNHLKVTRNGDAITLEVNGTPLGTWSDGTITGASGTGLIVSAYGDVKNAEASFDNFSVTGLGSSLNSSAAGTQINQGQMDQPAFQTKNEIPDVYLQMFNHRLRR